MRQPCAWDADPGVRKSTREVDDVAVNIEFGIDVSIGFRGERHAAEEGMFIDERRRCAASGKVSERVRQPMA